LVAKETALLSFIQTDSSFLLFTPILQALTLLMFKNFKKLTRKILVSPSSEKNLLFMGFSTKVNMRNDSIFLVIELLVDQVGEVSNLGVLSHCIFYVLTQ